MKLATMANLLSFFLLAACGTPSGKETISVAEHQKIIIKNFSDSLKADTFKVQVQGNKPEDMKLVFTITSSEAKEIYLSMIKASDLFKNYNATIDLGKKTIKSNS